MITPKWRWPYISLTTGTMRVKNEPKANPRTNVPARIKLPVMKLTSSWPITARMLTTTSQPKRETTWENLSETTPTETRETVEARAKRATPRPLCWGASGRTATRRTQCALAGAGGAV